MIISCEHCQARFRLADDKLKPGGTRVRCSKCQHVFTVMPPEPPPAEETIDFGEFNMERVTDQGAAAPPEPEPKPEPEEPPTAPRFAAESGARELDFGEEPPAQTSEPVEAAAEPLSEFGDVSFSREEPASTFDFSADGPDSEAHTSPPADSVEFSFDSEPAATEGAAPAFAFEPESDQDPFSFGTEEEAAAADSFNFEESGDAAFGDDDRTGWDKAGGDDDFSFDFDAPDLTTRQESSGDEAGGKSELGFGEIDFGESPAEDTPAFEPLPERFAATQPPPAPEAASPAPPVIPPPRPAPPRPSSDEPLSAPVPRRGSSTKLLLVLGLLLLGLCGAGAYFFLMGDGQQVLTQFLTTLKGEQPPAPVEQRIGLAIAGSSYVESREAGQLLVIQGTATNNFAGVRSAITVKGSLVDGAGKVLQQQTVFCGNYLSEEKLRTMSYAQIEEAMHNQFGDSLANMNVKPGTSIRFTIVFRNVPQNLSNINVEVVDSKPGGL